MERDVTSFALDPVCSPESILPFTLGACQLFALQPTILPCPWVMSVWLCPGLHVGFAELCPLDLATLAFAGVTPACQCEPCCL